MSLTGPYDLLSPQDQALAAAMASQGAPTPAAPSVYEFMPEAQIKAQRKAGDDLLAQAMSTAPIGGAGWAKGLGVLNRGLQGALGGMHQRAAVDAEKANEKARSDILTGAMGGGAIDWTALARDPSMRGVAVQGMMTDRQRKEQEIRDERRFEQQNKRDDERFAFQRGEAELNRQHQAQLRADQEAARREALAAAREGRTPAVVETADGIFTLKPDGTLGNRLGAPKRAPGSEAEKPPAGYRWAVNDAGERTLQAIPGGPADADSKASTKPLTQDERKVAGFANRMLESEKTLDALEAKGIHTGNARTIAAGNVAGNAIMTPEQQQYYQAASNWVRANLRKESGAAIGKDEMDKEIANYFPKPGDKDPVIAQKREMRERVARGLANESGRAYAQFGEIPEAPSAVRRRQAEEAARSRPPGGNPSPAVKAAPVPKPDTVVGGYRFKGGDPKDQANWEPAQ